MFSSRHLPTEAARFYDTHVVLWKFRPPCPACGNRTWPDRGLEDQEIFWCPLHGYWVTEPVYENEEELPLVFWQPYQWRFGQ